jgi:hypothetical protein
MANPSTRPASLDLRVQDSAALEEIELYSELIIVAASSARPLSRDQIDLALGVAGPRLSASSPAQAADGRR